MKILCVQGSLGRPSHTATMAALVARLLERQGAEVDFVDLRDLPLPTPDPRYHHAPLDHPDPVVRRIAEQADRADAFVLATPVYHNSYSGVLKCFLDHLDIPHFADKPVALCGNSGRTGSVQPVDHLRIVVRGLHGVAIPYQIVSRNGDYTVEGDRVDVTSADLTRRLGLMTDQLVKYAVALGTMRGSGGQLPNGVVAVAGGGTA
jgi:azobenzene reductase